MNEFLNRVYYGNTIQSYLIVVTIILLAVIIKKFVTKYATQIIFKMVRTNHTGRSKEIFDAYILLPVERLFMVIVIFAALGTLHFPKRLNHKIWGVHLTTIFSAIASGIFIIVVTSLLVRFLDFLVISIKRRSNGRTASENQLLFFFKDFIKVIIIIFGIVFILKQSFGVNVTKLLTGLSIVGAALALAARESLENIIASFVIFFDKPFVTGDIVKVKEFVGTVEKIGLRSTRITTFNGTMVAVPNKQMVDNILDNWSKRNFVQNELRALLPSKISAGLLQESTKELERLVSNITGIHTVSAFLQEINNDNAVVVINYCTPLNTPLPQLNEIKQDINLRVKKVQEEIAQKLSAPAG